MNEMQMRWPWRLGVASMLVVSTWAAAAPPVVLETVPASGDVHVETSLTEIRITFDQPMDPWGFSFVGGGPTFPEVTGDPRWETDRIAILPVELASGTYYQIGINNAIYQNFRGVTDDAAVPMTLRFCTKADADDPKRLHPEQNALAMERLRALIDERYSYRDRLDLDWDALFRAHHDGIVETTTGEAFALRLSRMLAAAEDGHVSVQSQQVSFGTSDRQAIPNIHYGGLLMAMPGLKRGQGVIGGRLRDDIGYMLIPSWSGQPEQFEQLYDVLEELDDTKGLVIDVRPNGGGDESLAQEFAGCFIVENTPYAKHVWRDMDASGGFSSVVTRVMVPSDDRPIYTGKVVVLMGPGCMSSCEAFLMMMRAVEGTVLIGEHSFGSSGNPRAYELGNGVSVTLPSWKAMTLDGEPFEGIGIAPDIEIIAQPADLEWEDTLLTKAVEVIDQ